MNTNKDKKWIYKEEEFKIVSKEELDSYLENGWKLGSPSSRETKNSKAKEYNEKVDKGRQELLQKILDAGIDLSEPQLAIPKIIEKGILPKNNIYKTLKRRLPEYFQTSSFVWITDGISNVKIDKDKPLPEGWKYGTTIRKGPNKNKVE